MMGLLFFSINPIYGQSSQSSGFQCYSEGNSVDSPPAQVGCNVIDVDCDDVDDLPYAYINVNFHFIGSDIGNLLPDDPMNDDDNDLLSNGNTSATLLLNNANARLANLQQGILTTNSFLGDSKVRLNLHTEAFNSDDTHGGVWFWENQAEYQSAIDNGDLNLYQGKVTNIEFVDSNGCESAGDAGSASEYGVRVYNYQPAVLECNNGNIVQQAAGTILHELFHDFDLCHSFACTNNGNVCGNVDLNVIAECGSVTAGFNCQPSCGENPDTLECNPFSNSDSHNIMGYNYTQNVLSCCQWEIMYSFVYSMNLPYISFRGTGDTNSCSITEQPLYLNTPGTIEWNTQKALNRNVIVESGTTLKINCNVYMAEYASISVRRGARLIVNNATITSMCLDKEWGGIQVNGNADKAHQDYMLDENFPLLLDDPGVAILLNAKIENAGTAISASRSGIDYDTQLAQRGGLIAAIGTEFNNNRRAVQFLKYNHPNRSIFRDCIFQGSRGKRAVTIWACNNIHFINCHFSDLGNLDRDGTQDIDTGITLLDGGMIVENLCIFENLTIGIACVNTVPMIFPHDVIIGSSSDDVLRNQFNENSRHIQASGMSDILIQRNTFGPRAFGGLEGQNAITGGVRVFDKSTFTIQKNSFFPTNLYVSRNENRIGKIEYNSFTSTTSAQETWGSIFVLGDSRATNFNFNCFFNETVTDVNYLNSTIVTNTSLNPVHGDDQTPYFNAFSENHATNRDINIRDYLPEMIYRYHPDADDTETGNPALIPRCGLNDNINVCSSVQNFTAYPSINPEPDSSYMHLRPCLSIIPEKPQEPKCLKFSCLDDLRAEIKAGKDKIDNGNTDYLVSLINFSPNSSASQQALEEATPYLSDEVLEALILSNQMNENLKENILANNAPLNAKTSKLVTDNLSSEFSNQIQTANESEGFSARRLLEIEIYTLEYEYAQGFEARIKQLSQANDYANLTELLMADGTVDSQRRLLGLEFRKNDFVAAQIALNNLPTETIDDGLFKEVQSINLEFLSAETPFSLSSQQKNFLYQVAEENHQSSSYARGLLMLLEGENFLVTEDLTEDAILQQSVGGNATSTTNNPDFAELTIYPNPAQQDITIQIPDNFDIQSNAILRIINANGILVESIKVNQEDYKINVNVADYPNGLYFTGLWQDETLTSFKRLIISK